VAKRKNQSGDIRRHDLVQAAMEIIRHEGVAKLTTRSLAQAVGIAQPTLFLHFGTKSHVLVALVDAIQERLQEAMSGLGLEALTPLERLKTVIRAHLNFIQQQPGIPRLLFSEELQSGDPMFRERMEQLVMFFMKFLTGLIGDAQKAGEIRADLVTEQAACLLIATIQGLALRWVLTGGERFVLSEQAEIVTSSLLEGWMPRT
jgi:AcrR family transcriptional regulator